MRLYKTYDFKGIKGFKLGWSLFGQPMMTVYCYVAGDLMMDTGQSHMQKEALEIAVTHKIKRVFLTHHHEDHSGNAAAIKQALDVRVFGHPLTKEKMKARFHILPYQKYVWGKAGPLNMETVPEEIETDLGAMIPIHTPGHSKDHTSYFLKEAGVLFSGDLYLADKIKFFRSDEDMGIQIASLKKILKLDFQTLLCGHHPKTEQGKKRIEKNLDSWRSCMAASLFSGKKGFMKNRYFVL